MVASDSRLALLYHPASQFTNALGGLKPRPAPPAHAVIICTRNRPADLRRTLGSIAALGDEAAALLVLVVDASDAAAAAKNRRTAARASGLALRRVPYPGPPSLTRQRNFGLDQLPASVEIVHFVDDDVTVLPGYFTRLAAYLDGHPGVGGVGGCLCEPDRPAVATRGRLLRRFFFLDGEPPGRVLPSGIALPAQVNSACGPAVRTVAWLSGCSSTYRRTLLDTHRFDPALSGYALFEDLDLSYRIGQVTGLAVVPGARLVHHRSAQNRHRAGRYAYSAVVHRYWFVQKNLSHPLRRAAFWWAMLGQALARFFSRHPARRASLRGHLRGIRTVLRRGHPLLRSPSAPPHAAAQ